MSVIELREKTPFEDPTVCTIETICYFNGSYPDFFEQHLMKNTPCLIINVVENWNCMKTWIYDDLPNIEYLNQNYGNAIVEVSNCCERYFNAQCKTTMSLSEFLAYWKDCLTAECPDSNRCLYMKDWHFMKDFPNDKIYTVPQCFSSDWLNEYCVSEEGVGDDYRFVYMGPKGSWTPFHADVFTSYSWSVNICGQKKWILFPPGEENKLKDKFGNLPYDINLNDLELQKKKKELDLKFYVLTQNVGEAIFVPSGWFHQVWNTKDTISINHNWINACNIGRMWISMKTNLQSVKEEISDIKDCCDNWEEQCQLLLKSCFGMDYKDFYTFLSCIMKHRLQSLQQGKLLNLHNGWELGTHHAAFDLQKARQMLKYLLSDIDEQNLNLYVKK